MYKIFRISLGHKEWSFPLLMAFCFCSLHCVADGPFRQHRYDSWKVIEPPHGAVVFVGNSITDMHNWGEAFGEGTLIVNRGNSGAVSSELLEHIDSWIGCQPSKVFIMIGTNDLGWDSGVVSVVRNIRSFVSVVHKKSPTTQVYLQSILPAYEQRNRSLETIVEVNEMLKMYADSLDYADYIDLYDLLLPLLDKNPYSLDGLHLEAYGYSLWCRRIGEILERKPVYAVNTDKLQYNAGIWGSHGMRASYFSMYPISRNDILFFGDEMVKNGEWNELLHSPYVKNRGTGWGYGGNIALTRAMVDASFVDNGVEKEKPSRMVVYTGTDDVNSTELLDSVKMRYSALVHHMQDCAPGVPVAVLSLMPTGIANNRIVEFNDWLRKWAEVESGLTFIDIYHPLVAVDGTADTTFIRDDYLYGKGYLKVAELLMDILKVAD